MNPKHHLPLILGPLWVALLLNAAPASAQPGPAPGPAPTPAPSPPLTPKASPAPAPNAAPAAAPPATPSDSPESTGEAPSTPPADTPPAEPGGPPRPDPSGGVPGFSAGASVPPPADAQHPPAPPAAQPLPPVAPSTMVPPVAAASSPPEAATDDVYSGKLGYHQDHWFAWIGWRSILVRDDRYDMFATDDSYNAFSVALGRTVFHKGNLSLAGVLNADFGGSTARARGENTSLVVQHYMLGGAARYHLHHRVFGYAHVGGGLSYSSAEIDSSLANATSGASGFGVTGHGKLGIAAEAIGRADGESRAVRVWLATEMGYTVSSPFELAFSSEGAGPERRQGFNQGDLSLSGLGFGILLAASY